MRTIIINTLGRELTQNPLFFLPFRKDQMSWLEQDLSGIEACAEEISAICNDQIKRQDYQLVVLADPVSFYQGEVKIARECYKKMIRACITRRLLPPLVSHSDLVPRSVTVIYMISHQEDGDRGIHADAVMDRVFGISAQDQPINQLRLTRTLPGGSQEYLDMTDLFSTSLSDHHSKLELRRSRGESLQDEMVFDTLRGGLAADLEKLQRCSYVPAGGHSEILLPIRCLDFIPQTTVPQLIWADLQLNLCDYLAAQIRDPSREPELVLQAHSQANLEFRLSRASYRIALLRSSAPRQSYYPLENQPRHSAHGGLTGRIWDALTKEAAELPGVAEARIHSENPERARPDRPMEKLRKAWFRVGQEKKLFHQLCTRLDSEYSPELVEHQQQTILNICAREFRQWRSTALRQKISLPPEVSETTQPEFDTAELRQKLTTAQQECTRVTAEKLDDYADVRQEAEVIKAKFRKAGRFWAPDSGSANTRCFQVYSLVLAILFLAQIMLPYVGITLGQANVTLDRYAHFLLSIAVFAGLYFLGLLFWLRGLCRELHGYAEQMSLLIWKSGLRREDSIEAVVNAYGSVLPRCMVLHDDLRELEFIHRTNETRKANFSAHIDCLKQADELLHELSTELQLSDRGRYAEQETMNGRLEYHLPPSHRKNLSFYTLLSDKWGGDASC